MVYTASEVAAAINVNPISIRQYMQEGLRLDAEGERKHARYTLADALRLSLLAKLLPRLTMTSAAEAINASRDSILGLVESYPNRDFEAARPAPYLVVSGRKDLELVRWAHSTVEYGELVTTIPAMEFQTVKVGELIVGIKHSLDIEKSLDHASRALDDEGKSE